MKVQKADKLGLCFGVRRAIKLLEDAVQQHREVDTLGPVAHNRLLVERLTRLGVKPITSLDQARGKILAITTHGASPEALSEVKARGIGIIDTTCPIVRRAQRATKELAEASFDVVIFGDEQHSEVKGLLGWAGAKGIAALDARQVCESGKSPARLGIVSQTTQTKPAFIEFVRELVGLMGSKIEEMRVLNTLCKVVQAQQEAAIRLALQNQLIVVIGGVNSANARHLVEICSRLVETHLVETPEEVDPSWLKGKEHVGITAGASTPDEAVEELVARLRAL